MSALPVCLPEFRRMRAADLPTVANHEAAAFEAPWTAGNFKDALDAGYECWVMQFGLQIAGHAVMLVAAGEAHLLNLTVAPNWQRRGYGSVFLKHLQREAQGHKADIMLLEVRPSNAAALQLYSGFGFEQIGLRRNYYPNRDGTHEDAWVFSCALVPDAS